MDAANPNISGARDGVTTVVRETRQGRRLFSKAGQPNPLPGLLASARSTTRGAITASRALAPVRRGHTELRSMISAVAAAIIAVRKPLQSQNVPPTRPR